MPACGVVRPGDGLELPEALVPMKKSVPCRGTVPAVGARGASCPLLSLPLHLDVASQTLPLTLSEWKSGGISVERPAVDVPLLQERATGRSATSAAAFGPNPSGPCMLRERGTGAFADSSISYCTQYHAQEHFSKEMGSTERLSAQHLCPHQKPERLKLWTKHKALVQNSDPSKPMSHVTTSAGEDSVPRRQEGVWGAG